ncbi:hypothetical protein NW759_017415, partial [Fusarium solani]
MATTVVNGSNKSAHSLDFKDGFVQIVDGKSAPTKETRHGINPANLQPKAKVPVATENDLDLAVKAAKRAFKVWSKLPYEDRRRAVLAYADALDSLRTEFRDLLISEQGKPIPQADAETDLAIGWIRGMANIKLPEDVIEDNEKRTV